MRSEHSSIGELIKDGAFCLAGLPLFTAMHNLALQLNIAAILESKLVLAIVTGLFMCIARLLEMRLSNTWRQRALAAEAKLKNITGASDAEELPG